MLRQVQEKVLFVSINSRKKSAKSNKIIILKRTLKIISIINKSSEKRLNYWNIDQLNKGNLHNLLKLHESSAYLETIFPRSVFNWTKIHPCSML